MSSLYSLPDAAKSLGGISIWTLRRHISKGHLRAIRIGRRVFLDGEELERIQREGLPSLRAAVENAPTDLAVTTNGQGTRTCR
jgi:hypothetical protein